MKVKSVNKNTFPERFARRLAELTAEVAELARRLQLIEEYRGAQQTKLTIHSYDDEQNSIEFLTENGFVIVRPWEAKGATVPSEGTFRSRVLDPDATEREINVEFSNELQQETALRTRGRIEAASQFWICCAERRLANYLMEHEEFPPATEMMIETLDREDVVLAIRWGKSL